MKNWRLIVISLTCLLISSCSSNSVPEADPSYQSPSVKSVQNKERKKRYESSTRVQVVQRKTELRSDSNDVVSSDRSEPKRYAKVGLSQQPGRIRQLPPAVKSSLGKQGIPTRGMSVYIQAVNNPNPLLTFQENTPRNPASVMKIVTSYAALGILGPNYRWPIEVYTTGSVSGGTLRGDLILKGYGNPDFKPNDLQKILQAVRAKGIRNIEGNLVFDSSHFAKPRKSAASFDGNPNKYYNTLPDALLYDENASCFVIKPKGKGKIDVSCDVPPRNVTIVNNMKANSGPCQGGNVSPKMEIIPQGRTATIRFTGRFSSRCKPQKFTRIVSAPANMLFSGIWKMWVDQMGGSINGGFAQHATPANAQLLHTYYSKPLRDVLPIVNKKSNNVMARQLLLSIAAKKYGSPATPEKGARAVSGWLQSRGLNFPELRIENGSGLSRVARISARHVGQLLADAYHSPHRSSFIRSLAVMGVDGTLKKRLVNSALRGRGSFKTGSLKNVRGIAGYVKATDGKTYIVSVLHNDPKARSRGRAAHDEVIKWAFSHPNSYASR